MKIGDYEIEAELGEGGMAKVYRAKHAFLETMHAIKVLDPEYRANAEARRRFLDEAKIQAKHLAHANIVKVTNIVATEQHAALVMELVDGPSLETALPELKTKPAEITRIMLGVLDAVGHAHAAGIIHRDLKPANVLLAREKGVLVPKVTDFGIAKVVDASGEKGPSKKSTHMASRMGTLVYMSPEQIRRAKDVTARSDIFSLGAMLYEMATGELAYPGESDFDVMENIVNGRYVPPATKYPGIDPRIAAVITKAMMTDPAQRYASCAEMADALRAKPAVVAPPPPRPPLPPPSPPAPPPVAKSKMPLVAGLCLVGAVGLGATALVIAKRGRPEPPASGSGSDVASAKAVSALRNVAAKNGDADPWAGSGSAHWDVAQTDFPEKFETPPDFADTSKSGVKYLPLTGDGRYTRKPQLGEHVFVNYRIWTTSDHKLVESNVGKPPVEQVITSDNLMSELLMTMTEHSSIRSWLSEPGKPAVVTDLELVEIRRWDANDKTFPTGADVPPSDASKVGQTRYVMLADNQTSSRSPGPGDHAKINFKTWRLSDHELVDFNEGGVPIDYTIVPNMTGRSEVLQQMTPGDVVRLWTDLDLQVGTEKSITPVLVEIELVSFGSTRCKGSYRSDDGLAITLTGDTSGPCGNYVFIDTSTAEKPMCSGRLSCNGASSKVSCDYKGATGVGVHLDGKVTWLCEGDVLHADVTIGSTITPWKLSAVTD